MGRPTMGGDPRLLALTHLAGGRPMPPAPDLQPANWMGASRNAVPGYDIPGMQVTRHRLLDMPIRTSSLRSLGAHLNVFAIESFMDELAAAAGADPVRFRLAHLTDPRARQVLTQAADMAGWDTRGRRDGIGYGVGVARYSGIAGYCAAVAEVEADTDIRVRRLWLAVDVGRVINPDGVINQVEGGAVQSASWTLREQVRFDRDTDHLGGLGQLPDPPVHRYSGGDGARYGRARRGRGRRGRGRPGTGRRRHRQRGRRRGRGARPRPAADPRARRPGDRGELTARCRAPAKGRMRAS